jgi:membrane protein
MLERIIRYIWEYEVSEGASVHAALHRFIQIMAMVARDLMGGMITLRAMSLVYTTLLSIVPLLAVSISVLKGFGVHDQLEPTLTQVLAPLGEKNAEVSSLSRIWKSACSVPSASRC